MYIISKNWHRYWFNYIWQSAAAGLVTAIAIYIFYDLVGLFILAGVGSTFFTIFALPNNRTARSRNILGSYVISIIVGLFCFNYFFSYVSGGLSVGLSTFLMVLTDTEHPPAAGIALGLALAVNNVIVYRGLGFALAGAVLSTVLRYYLKPWMRNLF